MGLLRVVSVEVCMAEGVGDGTDGQLIKSVGSVTLVLGPCDVETVRRHHLPNAIVYECLAMRESRDKVSTSTLRLWGE